MTRNHALIVCQGRVGTLIPQRDRTTGYWDRRLGRDRPLWPDGYWRGHLVMQEEWNAWAV